tara:strand:+ start:251 stop:904 length:654 start_codon:yes stop_codon:yes gene_type:complete
VKHRRATIINLSILTLLLAYFAAVSRPRTDKQVPRPDNFVREWPLYRSHRISKEGLRSTVSFLNKSGYWCTFDENARDKYQPRVAFSQRHEIRALLAKNGIPSQDTLIEVKEAATPTEIAGPYFEMPGEQQEALTARQAWREHVKQELEALLFSIEGVTKVEVSFDPIDMDAPIRSIQRVDIEISGDLSTEINLDGFRNQIFLMLDNDIPLEDITLK